MWQTIVKGGPVMIPIVLCSLLALTIIAERLIYFSSRGIKLEDTWPALQRLITSGQLTQAWDMVEKVGGLGRETFKAAIGAKEEKREVVEAKMQKAAQAELAEMDKGLYWLEVIVTIAPLLGLLGTVTGIINSFRVLSVAMASDPNLLSAGIAEALITTAAGLIVAVPSYVFFCYFNNLIKRRVNRLNVLGEEILALTVGENK